MNEVPIGITELVIGALTIVGLAIYWRVTVPMTFYSILMLGLLFIALGVLTLTVVGT